MGYKKTKSYRHSSKTVYDAALDALKDCNFNIDSKDIDKGIIEASTGLSLRSWGEDVQIIISKTDETIQLIATSNSKAQVIDWGKNEENIRSFFNSMGRYLE